MPPRPAIPSPPPWKPLNTASNDVVDGVRGDKSVGGVDGSLYEAMGYVRKSERNSGLTRKTPVAAAVTT
jgi:hypothetical protein